MLTAFFGGPPGYVGIPGGGNGNHLFILEAREGRENEIGYLTCEEGRMVGEVKVRRQTAQVVDCPPGSGLNSGHIMLVWTEAGIRYAVSLHSDTPLNRQLAIAVAEDLRPVGP